MAVTLRRAKPGATTGPAPFHAPLFHELVAGLKKHERHVALDLGAASTEMLALLGRSRCRVEIVDLPYFGGVDLLNTTKAGSPLADAAESLLPVHDPDHALDLVFCWDLPNYLTLPALKALMAAIRHRARPGALAHALIFYSDHDMQAQPGRFVPTPDGYLHDRSAGSEVVAAPRYSPEDLRNCMGAFMMDRARLLANGMQEFLFRFEP